MWKSLKRWLVLVVAAVALAVGLVFLSGNRVTQENSGRIKKGMTEAEVRAILGKPWDDSLLDPEGPTYYIVATNGLRNGAYNRIWVGDNIDIFVALDDNGRVASAKPVTHHPDRPHSWLPGRVWRRLRARYGW